MARKRFWEIRELPGIEKKPLTAELLTWLCNLSALRVDAHTLDHSGLKDAGKEALIKDYEDLQRLDRPALHVQEPCSTTDIMPD